MNYSVKTGDTLSGIAQQFGITVPQLQQWNQLADPDYIQVGQVLLIQETKEKGENYVVQVGDTLSEIALRFGVTVQQLQTWNNLPNPDLIQVGQWLFIEKRNGNSQSRAVSLGQLQAIGWYSISAEDVTELNRCLQTYKIASLNSLRHFISQCSHESGCGVWREELASGESYEGRSDLGNYYPEDGKKYKGAGYIQLTGRSNYTRFAASVLDPEILNQGAKYVAATYPWTSAGFWWFSNGMNEYCGGNPTVEQVTLRVNGGYNGLTSRKQYYQKCCEIFC